MLKVVIISVVLVCHLLVDAKTDNCTVPELNHGSIKKLTNDFYWDWRTFRFAKKGVNYAKIPSGTIVLHNSSVTLFCDTGYSLQGTSEKTSEITCFKGKWIPDPICHLHNCTVPVVKYGTIKELNKGDFYWNWRRLEYVKHIDYIKIPIGTTLPHNSSVTLFCDTEGTSRKGTSRKIQQIICTEGKWLPDPVCNLNNQRYAFKSATQSYQLTSLSTTTDQNNQRYISESTTQEYYSTGLLKTDQKNCTVPEVNYGTLKELNEGEFYWDWKKYQNVKRFNYVKIPIGTILTHNSSAILFCDTGYSLQGTSVKIQEITCTRGKWLPDPVCILNGQKYTSRSTIQNYQSSSLSTTTDQSILGCQVNKNEASQLIIEPMKKQYRFGEFIYLSCPPGQNLAREVQTMMCLGKTWSDTLPDCTER